MATFTPPVRSTAVPPILPRNGPGQTPLARRLFRHYRGRPEGINVYLLSNGTITEHDPDGTSVTWQHEAFGAPYVVTAWYGGHDSYNLTAREAGLLQAAGYTVVDSAPPTLTPPVLSSLSPATGVTGTLITLIGSNFSEVTSVTVSGGAVSFTILSSTAITITAPTRADGAYDVIATNASGSSSAVAFTYATPVVGSAPVISVVSPTSGLIGITVTLTGTTFSEVTELRVDGSLTSFTIQSGTSITFTAPSHADGAITVTVTNANGTSNAGTFTYTSAPAADPHPGADLLLEDGASFLLLEDGTSSLLQES